MKTSKKLRVILPHVLLVLVSAGLAAILIIGPLLSAPSARAAANVICSTTADGNWSDAIWDCGTPTSADDVVIQNEVTLSSDVTVESLTIGDYAILQFTAPVTLTINGNFTVNVLGVFDPGNDMDGTGGTVALGPGSQIVTTGGKWVDFYNLTKAASATGETLWVDPQSGDDGGIHVLNQLTLNGTASDNLLLRSTGSGQQAGLWPEFAPLVNYVDVQDSNQVGPGSISVPSGVDSGDNTNWRFNDMLGVVVTSSSNPSSAGREVTFRATFMPADATGSVEFRDGTLTIAECQAQVVKEGVATCSFDELSAGDHTITAVFTGSGAYEGVTGTSPALLQSVGSLSVVSLGASPHPSSFGDGITLTAILSPRSIGSGTVTFKNGGAAITGCENVAVQVVNNLPKATCSVTNLDLGSHTLTATFSGYDIFAASTSSPVIQVVKYASSVDLVAAQNPTVVGRAIRLTANILPGASGGSVTFKRGGVVIPGCQNVALSGGSAQCTIKTLLVGNYHFTAEYSGDSQTYGGVSSPMALSVAAQSIYMPMVGH